MLWHRQAIFEWKGDKLSSSVEFRIWSWEVSDTNSPADWMPFTNSTELSRIKLKNLNSTVRPYDEWAFSRLNFTANWLSQLALAIYMFVVNFDALAQASDFRIERRQVVFLCWMQDSKLGSLRHQFASRLNAHSHGWDNNDTKLSSNLNQDENSLSDLHTIYIWLPFHVTVHWQWYCELIKIQKAIRLSTPLGPVIHICACELCHQRLQ